MRIKPSYLEALQALGYSESEARFLYLAATHSGYFVARQFLFHLWPLGENAQPRSGAIGVLTGFLTAFHQRMRRSIPCAAKELLPLGGILNAQTPSNSLAKRELAR